MRKWECSNADCEDVKNGVFYFSMKMKKCKKCGSRMKVVNDGSVKIIGVGSDGSSRELQPKKWWEFWRDV